MNAKLLSFLNTLNKKEWKSFRFFLFKEAAKSKELLSFFDLLYERHNSALGQKHIEDIFKSKFSHLPRKSFFNQLSKIQKHLENWMVQQELKKDVQRQKMYLMKSFNRRGLYHEADKIFKKLENDLKVQKNKDLETQAAQSELYQTQFLSTNPIKNKDGNRIVDSWFKAHTIGYKEKSLQLISILSNWGQIKNVNFIPKINLLKNSIDSMESSQLSLLLETLELMIAEDNVDAFLQLKRMLIDEKVLNIDARIHRVVLSFLKVRFGRFWDKNLISNGKIFLEIEEYYLTHEVEGKEASTTRIGFLNSYSFLCTIVSYDDAEQFLNRWMRYVVNSDKDDYKLVLITINLFYHERYEEVLKLINTIRVDRVSEKIRIYRIELASLFKLRLEMPNLLFGKILNFKRFLHRNKSEISSRVFEATRNYIQVFERLLKNDFNADAIHLNQYKIITMRTWLNKQLKGVE